MAWARVQGAYGSTSSAATTVSAVYGSTPATGNKLIALVSGDPGGTPTLTAADQSSNAMTQVGTAVISGIVSVALFAMDVPAAVSTTITVTCSIACDMGLTIQEVSGLATGNTLGAMIDGTAGTSTGTTSPTTSPSYSSAAANEYLVCCFGDNAFTDTVTAPGGYTSDAANPTGASVHSWISYKNSSGGAESGSYTYSNSGASYGSVLVAFKQLSGAAPPAFAYSMRMMP